MPEVASVFTAVGAAGAAFGFGGGGASAAVRSATITIQLNDDSGVTGLQQEFERKATDVLRIIPGAPATLHQPVGICPVARALL